MHELAKQGRSMSDGIKDSFKEHGKDISKETQVLKKLIAQMEELVSRKPADNRAWLEKAFTELRDTLVADLAEMKARDDRLNNLVDKVDAIAASAFAVDIPDAIRGELSSFKDELIHEMMAASAENQAELKRFVEKLEAILAVGPGEGIKNELEEVLNAFRDSMITDLASLPQAQSDQITALTEQFKRISESDSYPDIGEQLQKALEAFRNDILAAVSKNDYSQLTELVERLEKTAYNSSTAVSQQIDEAIDRLRKTIVAEISGSIMQQVDELKDLTQQIDGTLKSQNAGTTDSHLPAAVEELKQHIESEVAVIRTALAGVQKPENSQQGNVDEILDAVRNSAAEVTKAVGEITQRLDEIARAQSSGDEQLSAVISAGDTAFGDESLARLADETASAKAVVAETLSKAQSIEKSVEEACKQIWAIREYAARQQDRMEKLQDGYDWNIIGNFCLRIIRCVDNLEDRIAELESNGRDARHLHLLRDELLFAMESSGVERFEVEVGSDFRGQEHRLKAQSQREVTDNMELIGKVARVVRPGYQCYISEDTTKTVRPAEVRVYGQNVTDEIEIGGPCK